MSYYEKNKEARKEYARAYNNTDDRKEYMKQYHENYRETEKGKQTTKIAHWKYAGLRCDNEWDEVYNWWKNATRCDICDASFETCKKCLDHDHILEGYNIRGILCAKCNNQERCV